MRNNKTLSEDIAMFKKALRYLPVIAYLFGCIFCGTIVIGLNEGGLPDEMAEWLTLILLIFGWPLLLLYSILQSLIY